LKKKHIAQAFAAQVSHRQCRWRAIRWGGAGRALSPCCAGLRLRRCRRRTALAAEYGSQLFTTAACITPRHFPCIWILTAHPREDTFPCYRGGGGSSWARCAELLCPALCHLALPGGIHAMPNRLPVLPPPPKISEVSAELSDLLVDRPICRTADLKSIRLQSVSIGSGWNNELPPPPPSCARRCGHVMHKASVVVGMRRTSACV